MRNEMAEITDEVRFHESYNSLLKNAALEATRVQHASRIAVQTEDV